MAAATPARAASLMDWIGARGTTGGYIGLSRGVKESAPSIAKSIKQVIDTDDESKPASFLSYTDQSYFYARKLLVALYYGAWYDRSGNVIQGLGGIGMKPNRPVPEGATFKLAMPIRGQASGPASTLLSGREYSLYEFFNSDIKGVAPYSVYPDEPRAQYEAEKRHGNLTDMSLYAKWLQDRVKQCIPESEQTLLFEQAWEILTQCSEYGDLALFVQAITDSFLAKGPAEIDVIGKDGKLTKHDMKSLSPFKKITRKAVEDQLKKAKVEVAEARIQPMINELSGGKVRAKDFAPDWRTFTGNGPRVTPEAVCAKLGLDTVPGPIKSLVKEEPPAFSCSIMPPPAEQHHYFVCNRGFPLDEVDYLILVMLGCPPEVDGTRARLPGDIFSGASASEDSRRQQQQQPPERMPVLIEEYALLQTAAAGTQAASVVIIIADRCQAVMRTMKRSRERMIYECMVETERTMQTFREISGCTWSRTNALLPDNIRAGRDEAFQAMTKAYKDSIALDIQLGEITQQNMDMYNGGVGNLRLLNGAEIEAIALIQDVANIQGMEHYNWVFHTKVEEVLNAVDSTQTRDHLWRQEQEVYKLSAFAFIDLYKHEEKPSSAAYTSVLAHIKALKLAAYYAPKDDPPVQIWWHVAPNDNRYLLKTFKLTEAAAKKKFATGADALTAQEKVKLKKVTAQLTTSTLVEAQVASIRAQAEAEVAVQDAWGFVYDTNSATLARNDVFKHRAGIPQAEMTTRWDELWEFGEIGPLRPKQQNETKVRLNALVDETQRDPASGASAELRNTKVDAGLAFVKFPKYVLTDILRQASNFVANRTIEEDDADMQKLKAMWEESPDGGRTPGGTSFVFGAITDVYAIERNEPARSELRDVRPARPSDSIFYEVMIIPSDGRTLQLSNLVIQSLARSGGFSITIPRRYLEFLGVNLERVAWKDVLLSPEYIQAEREEINKRAARDGGM